VVDVLLTEGNDVVVIDDLSAGDESNVDSRAHLEVVDISDAAALDSALGSSAPTAIFHLAAQASVTVSVADPHRDCEVNVQGTLNLLEAARRFGAPLTFSSTGGALYGNGVPIPTPRRRFLHRLPRTGRRSGQPRRMSARSPTPRGFHTRSVAWATCTDRARARTGGGRRCHLQPRVCGGPAAEAVRLRQANEGLRARGRRCRRDAPLERGRRHDEHRDRDRDSGRRPLVDLERAAGAEIEPELLPLREGELERSCMDPSRAAEVLGWRAEVPLEDGLAETYAELVSGFEAAPA